MDHLGFFSLRAPTYPREELDNLHRLPVDTSREAFRARILDFFERAAVEEALFLASPSLHARLLALRESDEHTIDQKALIALAKYAVRMCSRPTPFGLFASTSTGRIADRTRLHTLDSASGERHLRLDSVTLSSIVADLVRDPLIAEQLRWRPNATLYRVCGECRYLEKVVRADRLEHRLSSIADTRYLRVALEAAAGGALLSEIRQALKRTEPTLEEGAIAEYVEELVSNGILCSDLDPPITGVEPLAYVRSRLAEVEGAKDRLHALDKLSESLNDLASRGHDAGVGDYIALAGDLNRLVGATHGGRPLQVDLVKPVSDLTLGAGFVEEVSATLARLLAVGRRIGRPSTEILRFHRRFLDRYGSRWVPLLEALDDESGIGLERAAAPIALLEGVDVQFHTEPTMPQEDPEWTTALTHLLVQTLRDRRQEMVLTEELVSRFASEEAPLYGQTCSALFSVIAEDSTAVDAGAFQVLLHGMRRSGSALLGRFCWADEELCRRVRDAANTEQAAAPDVILAEVCYHPDDRGANISFRPILRTHEISCGSRGGVADDRQIPLTDILVAAGDGRILLYSKRFKKLVEPTLTSAHNFRGSSFTVYRFLAALAEHRGPTVFNFAWPGALADLDFLPRVTFRKVILARARWRIRAAADVRRNEPVALQRFIDGVREKHALPRYVDLRVGDQVLSCDLESAIGARLLFDAMTRNPNLLVEESLLGKPSCLKGSNGTYANEIVLPLICSRSSNPRQIRSNESAAIESSDADCPRLFPPGQTWVYVKTYCGVVAADRILCDHMSTMLSGLRARRLVREWHFVRYADPDPHLRLRLQVDDDVHDEVHRLVAATARSLVAQGLAWRVQFDTYEREIERYGGAEGILLCERLFSFDSDAALEVVRRCQGNDGEEARWKAALLNADALLGDFGLDTERKAEVMDQVTRAAYELIDNSRHVRNQVGRLFRERRQELQDLVLVQKRNPDVILECRAAFSSRSVRCRSVISALYEVERSGRMSGTVLEIAQSVIHMSMNRICLTRGREQELVLYDFLRRIYESACKREWRANESSGSHPPPRGAHIGKTSDRSEMRRIS